MKNTSTTEVADCYLGNIKEDKALATRVAHSCEAHSCEAHSHEAQHCLKVSIERKDCRKGRIFTQAASGQAVGIVKGRDWQLKDGDVLRTQGNQLVLVSLQKQQVIALQFEQSAGNSSIQLVNLGHVIGNHHWPIALSGETLYIELSGGDDMGDMVESTIKEMIKNLGIEGIHITREYKSVDHILDFSSVDSLSHSHSHEH